MPSVFFNPNKLNIHFQNLKWLAGKNLAVLDDGSFRPLILLFKKIVLIHKSINFFVINKITQSHKGIGHFVITIVGIRILWYVLNVINDILVRVIHKYVIINKHF